MISLLLQAALAAPPCPELQLASTGHCCPEGTWWYEVPRERPSRTFSSSSGLGASHSPALRSVRVIPHGETMVEGPLSVDMVNVVVRHQRQRLEYCYLRDWWSEAELSGKGEFTIEFVVGPGGTVEDTSIILSNGDAATTAPCIVNTFQRLRFQESTESTRATVSYSLRAGACVSGRQKVFEERELVPPKPPQPSP